jgi:hypothetical protein
MGITLNSWAGEGAPEKLELMVLRNQKDMDLGLSIINCCLCDTGSLGNLSKPQFSHL